MREEYSCKKKILKAQYLMKKTTTKRPSQSSIEMGSINGKHSSVDINEDKWLNGTWLNKMDLIYKPGDVLTGSNKLTDIEKETISREEYMVLHASENKAIEFYNKNMGTMCWFTNKGLPKQKCME